MNIDRNIIMKYRSMKYRSTVFYTAAIIIDIIIIVLKSYYIDYYIEFVLFFVDGVPATRPGRRTVCTRKLQKRKSELFAPFNTSMLNK